MKTKTELAANIFQLSRTDKIRLLKMLDDEKGYEGIL